MRHYEILSKDSIIAEYLPETKWYNSKSLMDLLSKYQTVYLKPNDNTGGNGIVRVKLAGNDGCVISNVHGSTKVDLGDLVQVIKHNMPSTSKYIVQQGIDLATYNNRPFDMRIVLQRVFKTWRVTLSSAKVATAPEAIVTNVAKGAEDFLLHRILEEYDQRQEPMAILREIIDLSHQIAHALGSQLPILIAGLDLALDKAGRLWFIEANEKPECRRCKLVNDEVSVKKYEMAKSIIQRSQRLKPSLHIMKK